MLINCNSVRKEDNMARYVDLDKFENYYLDCRIHNIRHDCDKNCVECYYNNSRTEEIAPVVHAKWTGIETIQLEVKDVQGIIVDKNRIGFKFNQRVGLCSNCHSLQLVGKYCIWCGAEMENE